METDIDMGAANDMVPDGVVWWYRRGAGMASIVEEYENEFRPFYDVAEAGKTAVWEFSQMFGEEDSDSESGDDSNDGTRWKKDLVFAERKVGQCASLRLSSGL